MWSEVPNRWQPGRGHSGSIHLFKRTACFFPDHIAQPIQAIIAKTVNSSRRGGVPSNLLMGSPREGGLGLIPWQQHILARRAVWAKRLTHHLIQLTPSTPPWAIAAATILQARSTIHPALQLLPSQPSLEPLPKPLERMRAALLSLGPMAPSALVHPHQQSNHHHPFQPQHQLQLQI